MISSPIPTSNNINIQKSCSTIYLIQAFFFWLNVSSYHIWSKLAKNHNEHKFEENKKLMRFAIYAQGMPLLICLLTLCVDELGENVKDLNKPNMGVYGCHLGYSRDTERPSFFETSLFLYLFLFVTMIMIANTIFLSLTFIKLKEGFDRQKDILHKQKKIWDQFMIITRCSILMGALWLLELISAALHVEYERDDICYAEFILDAPNLLIGFLIFLFQVVKKPVYDNLKTKVLHLTSKPRNLSFASRSRTGTFSTTAASSNHMTSAL